MANRILYVCALGSLLLAGAGSAAAQLAAPQASEKSKEGSAEFKAKVEAAERVASKDPKLKDLTPQQRKDLIEFVAGNMLYALLHEMGHASIQEMGLPVLGREEDAADSFAVLAMLKLATNVSDAVLIQAAKGWALSAARDEKEGVPLAFYDEHGLDKQRGYEIICLMVGSDPDKFADFANQVKMPEERQEGCGGDYSNASWSWETVLKPHLRAPDQPKQTIKVTYGPTSQYALIAQVAKEIGIVDLVANAAANRFVWRRPIAFDVKECGQPDLHWDISVQKVITCYEMAQDFANLYRGYGLNYVMPAERAAKAKKK